ncbi:MAG: hypothetical protein KatS3mg081_0840 [Gemmatimonadales bacterium]|nr:MAG: hypothetical protein KatS3mg081_0840 [Gemmatimonadales bacterium]
MRSIFSRHSVGQRYAKALSRTVFGKSQANGTKPEEHRRCERCASWCRTAVACFVLLWSVPLWGQSVADTATEKMLVSGTGVFYTAWRGPFEQFELAGLEVSLAHQLGGSWSVGVGFRGTWSLGATGKANVNTIAAAVRRYDGWRQLLKLVPLRAFVELRSGFVWATGSDPAVTENRVGTELALGGGLQVLVSGMIRVESLVVSIADFFPGAVGAANGTHIGIAIRLRSGPKER